MKIFVTGSGGMLGYDVCECLRGYHKITGLDIPGKKASSAGGLDFHGIDITDRGPLSAVFREEAPEVVIHCAAWTDVDGCEEDPGRAERVNFNGTVNTGKAALDVNAHLIFISTDFIFDGNSAQPYLENDPAFPLNVYGKTKLRSEEWIKENMASYTVVRTSWLFGRHGRNFAETIRGKALSGERLRIVDDQTGSPTYTRDLALSLGKIIDQGDLHDGQTYHITNSGQCSWYEFAKEIVSINGLDASIVEPISSGELTRAARRPLFSVLSNENFNKRIKHHMRPWQEALKEYFSYEHI